MAKSECAPADHGEKSGTAESEVSETEAALVRLPKLLEELSRLLEALKSAIVAGSDDEVIIETAESLWTIVDEAMDVVETVDFEELPEAIDFEELPDAIEAEKLSAALEAGDAAEAIDLAELYEAVDLRELWRTVDLPALRKEGAELEEVIAVFLDDGENGEGSEPNDDNGILNVRDATSGLFGAESRQQVLQQRIGEAIDAFRVALLETHATVRRLYEANQRKHGQSGRRSGSRSRNPTAYSTLPRGPLPGPTSTRASTVPTRVRHSRTKGRPRIYGRRFERAVGR